MFIILQPTSISRGGGLRVHIMGVHRGTGPPTVPLNLPLFNWQNILYTFYLWTLKNVPNPKYCSNFKFYMGYQAF